MQALQCLGTNSQTAAFWGFRFFLPRKQDQHHRHNELFNTCLGYSSVNNKIMETDKIDLWWIFSEAKFMASEQGQAGLRGTWPQKQSAHNSPGTSLLGQQHSQARGLGQVSFSYKGLEKWTLFPTEKAQSLGLTKPAPQLEGWTRPSISWSVWITR